MDIRTTHKVRNSRSYTATDNQRQQIRRHCQEALDKLKSEPDLEQRLQIGYSHLKKVAEVAPDSTPSQVAIVTARATRKLSESGASVAQEAAFRALPSVDGPLAKALAQTGIDILEEDLQTAAVDVFVENIGTLTDGPERTVAGFAREYNRTRASAEVLHVIAEDESGSPSDMLLDLGHRADVPQRTQMGALVRRGDNQFIRTVAKYGESVLGTLTSNGPWWIPDSQDLVDVRQDVFGAAVEQIRSGKQRTVAEAVPFFDQRIRKQELRLMTAREEFVEAEKTVGERTWKWQGKLDKSINVRDAWVLGAGLGAAATGLQLFLGWRVAGMITGLATVAATTLSFVKHGPVKEARENLAQVRRSPEHEIYRTRKLLIPMLDNDVRVATKAKAEVVGPTWPAGGVR
jgi:hypothetical protein